MEEKLQCVTNIPIYIPRGYLDLDLEAQLLDGADFGNSGVSPALAVYFLCADKTLAGAGGIEQVIDPLAIENNPDLQQACNTIPTLTLIGDEVINLKSNNKYTEHGIKVGDQVIVFEDSGSPVDNITVTDDSGFSGQARVSVTYKNSNYDYYSFAYYTMNSGGTYIITYSVTNSCGNESSIIRTVNVVSCIEGIDYPLGGEEDCGGIVEPEIVDPVIEEPVFGGDGTVIGGDGTVIEGDGTVIGGDGTDVGGDGTVIEGGTVDGPEIEVDGGSEIKLGDS